LHLATQKLHHLVKKLWRMRLRCGRMRKTEKYSSSANSFYEIASAYHATEASGGAEVLIRG
jgi:hypothetical protein